MCLNREKTQAVVMAANSIAIYRLLCFPQKKRYGNLTLFDTDRWKDLCYSSIISFLFLLYWRAVVALNFFFAFGSQFHRRVAASRTAYQVVRGEPNNKIGKSAVRIPLKRRKKNGRGVLKAAFTVSAFLLLPTLERL